MPDHDVTVVGGGISGLRAALAARTVGLNVAVISKLHPMRSPSVAIQSGINAALGEGDSWEIHASDTVRGGDFLSDQEVVEAICREAPKTIFELDHIGALFDRDGSGVIDLRRFSGSCRARGCYCADMVGQVILQTLYEQCLKCDVTFYDEWFVTALDFGTGACQGLSAIEMITGNLHYFSARAVVLATGGLGMAYDPTTNSLASTGDGISLAYRAGVPLRDMEMVQYHPTTIAGKGIFLSEAALSHGAFLINKDGERFMESYAHSLMELAPGDVVCRAIAAEVEAGRGVEGGVLLDAQHIGRDVISEYLPQTRELASTFAGVDLSKGVVPVRPAAHRCLGGIATDPEGATQLPGLFAVGECASSGFHGACSLGGNFLTEAVVMGNRGGRAAAQYALEAPRRAGATGLLSDEERRIRSVLDREPGPERPAKIRKELGIIMGEKAGILRDAEGLREAADALRLLFERYHMCGIQAKGGKFNFDLTSYLELGHMLELSELIVKCALAREECRGVHYRKDFPMRDNSGPPAHLLVTRATPEPKVTRGKVGLTRWTPGGRVL